MKTYFNRFPWLMKNAFIIIVLFPLCLQAQRFTENNPVIKGYTIPSKVLKEERKLFIYQPEIFPEYSNAVSPIIYVLDGDAYMNYFAAFVNMICERFVQMPPVTIVSVENVVNDDVNSRNRDFTPVAFNNSSDKNKDDGPDNFLRFMQEELFPFVEKNYKSRPFRIMAGHSLSSLFVLHTFLQSPALFNAYIASSPGMDINNPYFKVVSSSIENLLAHDNTLFLSSGNESYSQPVVKKIDSLLQNKKIKNLSFRTIIYPNETHFSVFLKSFYDGFRFIFHMDPLEATIKPSEITYRLLEEHYDKLSSIFGYAMKPPEDITSYYGYQFLEDWNDLSKALEFFKKNIENYPQAPYVYHSYGEALLKKGDMKNAMVNFEKAFELDPKDEKARNIVKKLKSDLQQKK